MNRGRNDPCHCGSGKKYKKCCLEKDEEARRKEAASPTPKPLSMTKSAMPNLEEDPEPPPDPYIEAWNARYEEFEAGDYEARVALFNRTLDEVELMDADMAFETLEKLFHQAAERDDRDRYDSLIESLRERLPEVYQKQAYFLLENRITNALVMKRPEAVHTLSLELAALAGDKIDTWNDVESRLAYHGYLDTLVEAMRLGWPEVRSSDEIVPWGIDEFNERALQYETLNYIAKTPDPKGDDPALLERLRFFAGDGLDADRTRVIVGYLSGQTERQWTMDDFKLAPPKRRSRRDWDDEEEDEEEASKPDPARVNLYDLTILFVNYAHCVEGVAWTKANLASDEIFNFIVRRKAGELEYRESMLDSALRPAGRKREPIKKFKRYEHLLCPDRERLDMFLAEKLQPLNYQPHEVSAMAELVPAWMRFLQTQGLVDAGLRKETLRSLKPLAGNLLTIFDDLHSDPTLREAIKRLPEDFDKELQ
ncbi:MAG TPA: SEC-C metal-binding domain-containing protein [Blastocatellia bacterium]|nr:SEC-C metal-binding domain-containing protein [Blastocatellia bacterium]